MTQTIQARLSAMSQSEVVEAAWMALPRPLGIASEDDARERLIALSGLSDSEAAQIDKLAADAIENSGDVVDLLRAVMSASADEGDLIGPAMMHATLDHVGERQIAISADMYGLGVLLIACYIAYKGQGRSSTETTTTIETMEDNRKKTVISNKVVYLNPFSPLVTLIETLLGRLKGGAAGAITDETKKE
jgi:hypothetical protein